MEGQGGVESKAAESLSPSISRGLEAPTDRARRASGSGTNEPRPSSRRYFGSEREALEGRRGEEEEEEEGGGGGGAELFQNISNVLDGHGPRGSRGYRCRPAGSTVFTGVPLAGAGGAPARGGLASSRVGFGQVARRGSLGLGFFL